MVAKAVATDGRCVNIHYCAYGVSCQIGCGIGVAELNDVHARGHFVRPLRLYRLEIKARAHSHRSFHLFDIFRRLKSGEAIIAE